MHPKNSTTPDPVQQPLTRHIPFGDPLMEYTSPLFWVESGGSMAQAVETASDLADGLTQLLMRQHQAISFGENIYAAETKALAFLSQAIWALACSAKCAMHQQAEQQEAAQ